MPADLYQRVAPRLDFTYAPFLALEFELAHRCRERGAVYFITRLFSTYAEQSALWKQGRTILFDAQGKKLPIVTKALGGQSAHNFGIASDRARDLLPETPKLEPTWRPEDYVILGEEAERMGLVWGGRFKSYDGPHVQWPDYETAKECLPLAEAFHAGGLQAVFRHLDEERKTEEWQERNPLLAAELERIGFGVELLVVDRPLVGPTRFELPPDIQLPPHLMRSLA